MDAEEKEKIRQAIRTIVRDMIPKEHSEWVSVKSVTGQTCTVTISDGSETGTDIEDILLGYEKSDVIVYPKVNSDVLVLFTDNKKTKGAVIMVEETDKVEIMGINFGGLGLTEKIAERLKRLEDGFENFQTTFNNHLTTYSTHTHPGVTAGGGVTGSAAPDTNTSNESVTPRTDQDYISNTKVKHGDGN